MARKFLTIPATSVSSQSTFSTGGRVLDDYRSSLHPKMVEALVCATSFIKGAKNNNINPVHQAARLSGFKLRKRRDYAVVDQ
ncbi:unnamed protein product [Triticum turgidum subsp. durum]|uniref:HAT C-terminal dimerisation domain-containing protein n=1 Tax=Triticum turgidum subsp. durum TaxID=4567 RepID=A0A9R0SET3_TRITD|nr:unnamed protein product [Triticum turgidum subsp. durum]